MQDKETFPFVKEFMQLNGKAEGGNGLSFT